MLYMQHHHLYCIGLLWQMCGGKHAIGWPCHNRGMYLEGSFNNVVLYCYVHCHGFAEPSLAVAFSLLEGGLTMLVLQLLRTTATIFRA